MESTIRKARIFTYLASDDFVHLRSHFKLISYSAQALIIRQGNFGEGLYIIKTGKVTIMTRTPGNEKVILSELSEGAFFGETSLFAKQPSSASVFASTPVEVYFLSNKVIEAFSIINPLLAHKLIRAITEITVLRIRAGVNEIKKILREISQGKARQFCAPVVVPLKSPQAFFAKKLLRADDPIFSKIFKNFNLHEIEILLSYMDFVEAEDKALLFCSGEKSANCYLTLTGVVHRIVDAGRHRSKFSIAGPGEMIGQDDFIAKERRNFTAIVRESSQFLSMNAEQQKLMQGKNPLLWARFYYLIAAQTVKILFFTNQLVLRLMRESVNV